MKPILALAIAFCVSATTNAQFTQQSLQQKLNQYTNQFEPEQIDVHLDKQLYFTGDRLWYSLYLNSIPRAENSLSSIVYFEIRSKSDSVILRQKTRCKNGLGHGDLLLPRQFPTGTYKVAAYTLWMLNTGSVFTMPLQVVNLEMAQVPVSSASPSAISGLQLKGSTIAFDAKAAHTVFVSDQQAILYTAQTDGSANQHFEVDLTAALGSWVYVVALDEQGRMLDKKSVSTPGKYSLTLRTARSKVEVRGRNEIQIDLTDREGRPVTANLSVAVHAKLPDQATSVGEMTGGEFLSAAATSAYSREAFIYPVSQNALDAVPFSIRKADPGGLLIDTIQLRTILNDMGVKKRIMRAYDAAPDFEEESNYLLPANNSYKPADYTTLTTVPEMIREVVPTIRIRKSKAGRKLHVRNSDNPSYIYIYKEPALVLVDGVVIDDIEKVLALPLQEIESIDVVWGVSEINRSGLFSLADNGIVSIHTRSKNIIAPGALEVFKGIQQPLRFSLPVAESKNDPAPVFTDVLYWNPAVRVVGRERLNMRASDDLGTWVVEIKGLTEAGEPIYAATEFTVSPENP